MSPISKPTRNWQTNGVLDWAVTIGKKSRTRLVRNPIMSTDSDRSIPLNQFAPLAAAEGVDFFSLQKGHAGKQFSNRARSDWTDELVDFAGTAALWPISIS